MYKALFLTAILFIGCTAKQTSKEKIVCASNGYYYKVTPQKMEIMKDKDGNFLPCTDERVF